MDDDFMRLAQRKQIVCHFKVPIHAYHAYDAVMIYAKALTESLRDGHDPRNGTAIMERIRNRPYHSVLGFDVSGSSFPPSKCAYCVLKLYGLPRLIRCLSIQMVMRKGIIRLLAC